MKKLLFISSLMLFIFTVRSYSEKVISTYSLSYFNKQYDIEASDIKNGQFSLYVQVNAEKDFTRAMIGLKSQDIPEFIEFLNKMKEKYIEWSDVAKTNKVINISKDMDLKSPSITICWSSSEWFFSFGQKLQPRFLVIDNGKMVVSIYKKVTASSNRYIDEEIYWVFSDPKEIDELILQLNINQIMKKLQEDEKAGGLFK